MYLKGQKIEKKENYIAPGIDPALFNEV